MLVKALNWWWLVVQNPVWNYRLALPLPVKVDMAYIEIFDECMLQSDQMIAWTCVPIPEELTVAGGDVPSKQYELSGKQGANLEGKISGKNKTMFKLPHVLVPCLPGWPFGWSILVLFWHLEIEKFLFYGMFLFIKSRTLYQVCWLCWGTPWVCFVVWSLRDNELVWTDFWQVFFSMDWIPGLFYAHFVRKTMVKAPFKKSLLMFQLKRFL